MSQKIQCVVLCADQAEVAGRGLLFAGGCRIALHRVVKAQTLLQLGKDSVGGGLIVQAQVAGLNLRHVAKQWQVALVVGLGVGITDLAGALAQAGRFMVKVAVQAELVQVLVAHHFVAHQLTNAGLFFGAVALLFQLVPEVVALSPLPHLLGQVHQVALLQFHLALHVVALIQLKQVQAFFAVPGELPADQLDLGGLGLLLRTQLQAIEGDALGLRREHLTQARAA